MVEETCRQSNRFLVIGDRTRVWVVSTTGVRPRPLGSPRMKTDVPMEVRRKKIFWQLPATATEDRLESTDPPTVTCRFGLLAQIVVQPGEKIVGRQQFRIDRDRRLQ